MAERRIHALERPAHGVDRDPVRRPGGARRGGDHPARRAGRCRAGRVALVQRRPRRHGRRRRSQRTGCSTPRRTAARSSGRSPSTSGATIPIAGAGAGTFTAAFYARDDRVFDTENGHSLYFETLGELGIIGGLLVLLVVADAARGRHPGPARAARRDGARRLRRDRRAGGVDTDWESPAVIVPALLLGGAVVAAARGRRLPVGPARPRRAGRRSRSCLAAAERLRAVGQPRDRRRRRRPARPTPVRRIADAKRATDRMPWSARTWQALAGHVHQRRRSRCALARAYARALEQAPTDFRLWYASAPSQDPARRRGLVRQGPRAEPAPEAGRRHRAVRSGRVPAGGLLLMARQDPLANPEEAVRRVYAYAAYRLGDGAEAEDVTSATIERALRYRVARTTRARATRRRGWSASRGAPSTSTTGGRRWPRRSRRCRSAPTTTRSRTAPSSASRWPPRSAGSTRASAS